MSCLYCIYTNRVGEFCCWVTSLLHVKYKETRTSSPKETTDFIGRESWRRPTQLCKWPSCFAHIRRESKREREWVLYPTSELKPKKKRKLTLKSCVLYRKGADSALHTHTIKGKLNFGRLSPAARTGPHTQNPTDSRISNQRESQFTLYNRMRKREKEKRDLWTDSPQITYSTLVCLQYIYYSFCVYRVVPVRVYYVVRLFEAP